jgi:hypothetical protein
VVHCGQSTRIQGTFMKHTKLFLQSSRDADEAGSSSVAECRLTMQYSLSSPGLQRLPLQIMHVMDAECLNVSSNQTEGRADGDSGCQQFFFF